MKEPEILFEVRGPLGFIVLNRPAALNALNRAMCEALLARLAEWAADDAIRAVAIRGRGRAFCAGGDIRAAATLGASHPEEARAFYRAEYRLNAAIGHFPKPYVALISGIVMGGGAGISVHGTYRVADETTLFAMPETGIGFFPDVGASFFLPRCPGRIGLYLGLTGARIGPADALYAGLATHVVRLGAEEALLEALAAGEDPAKVLAGLAADPGPAPLAEARDAIDRCFAGESVEAILAALDGEPGDFARAAAAILRTRSPTSLKIAFRALREGARRGLAECLRTDYRIAARLAPAPEFREGVRAVLIDRDGSPRWNPPELTGVSDKAVDAYFAPLDRELSI